MSYYHSDEKGYIRENMVLLKNLVKNMCKALKILRK